VYSQTQTTLEVSVKRTRQGLMDNLSGMEKSHAIETKNKIGGLDYEFIIQLIVPAVIRYKNGPVATRVILPPERAF
jgi:hypothetical protein